MKSKIYASVLHLENIGQQIAESWGNKQIFLDLLWVDEELMTDGSHPLSFIMSEARKRSLKVIPVTGYDRDPSYIHEVRAASIQDKLGVCFRIEDEDFLDLDARISYLLSEIGISPSEVDLLIDFKAISSSDEKSTLISAVSVINSMPHLNDWRTLTFAASAFPENMSSIVANTVGSVPRTEWNVWKVFNALGGKIKRIPSFGDYGISHPALTEVDPRIMQMSANIRYSTDDEFLLFKGTGIRRNGWAQTQVLCERIVKHRKYSGNSFNWGDRYIYECYTGTSSTGNAETWRRVGTNHHLSLVANQLANLP